MNHEIKSIPFEGSELLGVKTDDGKIWLGVKKACLDIGLSDSQARTQIQKIADDYVLKGNCQNILIVQNEGHRMVKREIACINEDYVTLWLAKIQLTDSLRKKAPQAVGKLISYQLKAQKVLHNAFMSTDAKKQELYSDLGIKGDIAEVKERMTSLENTVKQMIDNTTINSRQAQTLLAAAKNRVNVLLGGAHSLAYRANSRVYFKNLWLNLCDAFSVGSYKDLNPAYIDDALMYINRWEYL